MKTNATNTSETGFQKAEHIFAEIKTGLMNLLPEDSAPGIPAAPKTEGAPTKGSGK